MCNFLRIFRKIRQIKSYITIAKNFSNALQEGEVDDDDEAETEKAASVASEATGMVALPRVLSASTSNSGKPTLDKKQQPVTEDSLNLIEEVLNFQTNCPNCGAPAETKMKVTSKFICINLTFWGLTEKIYIMLTF